MRPLLYLIVLLVFSSCWDWHRPTPLPIYQKVWGYKPVYTSTPEAKQIAYLDSVLPVENPGNIYVLPPFIYQLENGKGIHVIDNHDPANAHRSGFIRVNGASQISIKDGRLYTNSYNDLLILDVSQPQAVSLVKRMENAFPEGLTFYPFIEPPQSGYFECPRYDSVVTGWVMDSVYNSCYKN